MPVTTGHLAAMRRRGLVKRVGFSTYALSYHCDPSFAPLGPRTCSRAEQTLRLRLRQLLAERRSIEELCAETRLPPQVIVASLRGMWLSGVVTGCRADGYQLVSAARIR